MAVVGPVGQTPGQLVQESAGPTAAAEFGVPGEAALVSPAMDPLLAAKVWTYWISWFLLVPGLLMVAFTIIGYLVKVQSQKYPRK
ncbi:MAG: hypothetical protein AVDCRST_MAG76-3738 [uncultured Acidimicrobiales bacterium]|uniref:Uncharacterized protein n=1 Tax=uncultured Acidimicrobiales bacterium TaxID=310071 RepID=A0A6J4JGN1_9ACTN|nr:MAG: hypothetical protein AVDCRST_MAG76-3738 [uncultured Acidimicrobiales bacterium]